MVSLYRSDEEDKEEEKRKDVKVVVGRWLLASQLDPPSQVASGSSVILSSDYVISRGKHDSQILSPVAS